MSHIYFLIFALLTSFFLTSHKIEAHKYTEDEINTIIENFIQNNPEIIEDSLKNLRIKKNSSNIKSNLISLSRIPNPKLIRKGSDVTIYEFFDYNCGYCKLVAQSLFNVFEKDKKVNIVFVEFPILSESSVEASLIALALQKQKKYFQLHLKLMNHKGKIDQKMTFSIANELGVDVKKLRKDISDSSLMEIIKSNRQIANKLNIQGTPAFIIGNKIYPGAISENEIMKAIKIERNNLK